MMFRTRIVDAWDRIRGSFWFLPALMALAAAVLAFGILALDRGAAGRWIASHGLGYGGGAEGASTVLQTIASSMMTIAGVVFSMTLVALSLASSQFGSRLLRNFMRDTTNQVVLGVFVATFLYCILVLRAVRRADESLFVPQVAVAVGVVLAVASIAVLVYFIHHVSTSIQADEVIARVGAETLEAIERMFPERIGRPGREAAAGASRADAPECESRPIAAAGDGYLQRVDPDALMAVAAREDLVVRLCRRPGDYVVAGTALAWAWPQERVDDGTAAELAGAFAFGTQRTPVQDLRFCLQQLVEIAARALSPGVNDPYTALASIDRIASALHHLAGREMPRAHRLDDRGHLRVIAIPTAFPEFVDAAFDPLRRHSRGDAAVTIRLLEAICAVAPATRRADDREALARQAGMIASGASEALPEAEDRHAARQAYEAAMESLRPRKLIPLHAG
jgi:uncharacterized membrane protein